MRVPRTATVLAAALLLAGCGSDPIPSAPAEVRLARAASAGRVTHRSIAEFLAAQPNYCLLPGNPNNCDNAQPGIDLLSFTDPARGTEIVLDYPGIASAYLSANGGPDLGTTFSGHVTERVLNDGRAEITVLLRTENALAYVVEMGSSPYDPTILLGATPTQVLAGAPAALGSSMLMLTYIAPAPGMPLVAISQVLWFERDRYELVKLQFHAQAEGVLHAASGFAEGTMGRVLVQQTGRLTAPGLMKGDQFPAEFVKLTATGR